MAIEQGWLHYTRAALVAVLAAVLLAPEAVAQVAEPPHNQGGGSEQEPPPPGSGNLDAPPLPPGVPNETEVWTAMARVAGINRYGTAAALSVPFLEGGTVYIASGVSFADALAGGPAAARAEAPLLLTAPDRIPEETAEALTRLKPANIVLLGGPSAVSTMVAQQLASYAPVQRLAGASRYETAVEISASAFPGGADTVLVATGENYPDALSAAARGAAAHDPMPVLLVPGESVPSAVRVELQRLAPDTIVVVGGEQAVSRSMAAALATIATVERVAGADREATSALLAADYVGRDAGAAFLATGFDFADALAAAPVAGLSGVPVLLVNPGRSFSAATREAVESLGLVSNVFAVGGNSVMSNDYLEEVTTTLNADLPGVTAPGQPSVAATAAGAPWAAEEGVFHAQAFVDIGLGGNVGPGWSYIGTPGMLTASGTCDFTTRQMRMDVYASVALSVGAPQTHYIAFYYEFPNGSGAWGNGYSYNVPAFDSSGIQYPLAYLHTESVFGQPGQQYNVWVAVWRLWSTGWSQPAWTRVGFQYVNNGVGVGLAGRDYTTCGGF